MRNLITDVPGVLVGNAEDAKLASGVTAIVFEQPAVASGDVRGGAPGTRETDLLRPDETIERVDAVVLSGGSAFGLDAPGGTQAWLREQGRGFVLGPVVVPIVPGAILFDLTNGGNKDWGRFPPYRDLGFAAAANAARDFSLGNTGAGLAATTVNLTVVAPIASAFELVGSVRDLFNVQYSDPASDQHRQDSIPQNGRTLRVGLTWKLWAKP